LRGYILVKLHEPLDHDALWELTRKYESIEGIEFASNVIGSYDYVLTVDTKDSFERVIEKARELNPQGNTVGLKSNESFGKHREIKDLKIFNDLAKY